MITVLVIFWYGFGNLLFSDYTDLNMIAPIICKRIMVWHPGQGRSLLISGHECATSFGLRCTIAPAEVYPLPIPSLPQAGTLAGAGWTYLKLSISFSYEFIEGFLNHWNR